MHSLRALHQGGKYNKCCIRVAQLWHLLITILGKTLKRSPEKGTSDSETTKMMTTTEIMKSPGVSRVLFIYTFTMLLALAYTASKFSSDGSLLCLLLELIAQFKSHAGILFH